MSTLLLHVDVTVAFFSVPNGCIITPGCIYTVFHAPMCAADRVVTGLRLNPHSPRTVQAERNEKKKNDDFAFVAVVEILFKNLPTFLPYSSLFNFTSQSRRANTSLVSKKGTHE